MTDQLPSSGGSYIRLPDGTLKLDEAPTALEIPVEEAVQAPFKRPVKEA